MDYAEFVADRAAITYPERKDAQQEVLEQADAWSDFFDNAIMQRLNCPDNRPLMGIDALTKKLNEYEDWCNGPLEPLRESLLHHQTDRSRVLTMYLNFHAMSDYFMQHWFRLIAGTDWNAAESRRFNSETQDFLALSSVELQKKREKLGERQGVAASRTLLNGILGEYDAAIVALDTMKSHPELLLLPAPGRFEHVYADRKNADFLIFDTQAHEVIGMQVKTSVDKGAFARYDPNFVFLVDTATDLGDVLSKKIAGKSEKQLFNRPGLIAAHHMRNWPKQMNMTSHPWLSHYVPDERTLMGLKFYANMLTQGTRDTSLTARQHVGERTLAHLYRKPVYASPLDNAASN